MFIIFFKYLDWVKENGYWPSAESILKDYEKLGTNLKFRHVDILKQSPVKLEPTTGDVLGLLLEAFTSTGGSLYKFY